MSSPSLPNETHCAAARLPRWLVESMALLAVLAALVFFFHTQSENFLRAANLSTIANQVPKLTVIAVGMTFVLIAAGIDLSVGSVLALSSAVMGVLMVDQGWPVVAAVPLGLTVGLLCGLVNGLVSVAWSIPAFIVTLGTLEIARGVALEISDQTAVYVGSAIESVGMPLSGIMVSPAFILAVGVVLAGQFVLSKSRFGRHVIAVGANEQAARLSGIRPGSIKVAVFAFCGMMAALGGWFDTSLLSAADPSAGKGLELSAIAAVVIGGTSLMGGRGSVTNSFLGVLIIAVLESGLATIGAKDPTKHVITGAVIVAAVVVDVYRQRLAAR